MTVSNVTVYGTEQVDWVITNTNIPKDGSSPKAVLAYIIQYPYAITSWTPDLAESGAGSLSLPGTVQSFSAANSTLACSMSDYSASDTATTATCKKNGIQVTFAPADSGADSCKFSNYVYTLAFDVKCVQGLPDADCPLNQTNAYTMAFTVNSENFCTALAANNTINNVITINNFTGVAPTNGWAQQNAWRENDDGYFQMGFSGLSLQTIKMTGLKTDFGADSLPGTYATTVVAVTNDNTAIPGAAVPGFSDQSSTVAGLGLDASGTLYRFKVQLTTAFMGAGSALVRGRDYFLKLQATIDVTYDRAFSPLRRRRQAQTEAGSGIAESETQSMSPADSTAAQTASSPASRVAGSVAAVLALTVLSSVMLA